MGNPSDLTYSMKMVFKHVVTTPLGRDPRTDWRKGILLGNTHEANRRDVLQSGFTDFNVAYQQQGMMLTCAEKCLLYCHYYLKYTFFACKHAFAAAKSKELLGDDDQPVCLLDIGCGPGTSGLAFADTFFGMGFVYVGIDVSTEMLALARRIFN